MTSCGVLIAENISVLTIDAPHFNAGVIIKDDVVIKAAPILRYMLGWNLDQIKEYCIRKKWLTD